MRSWIEQRSSARPSWPSPTMFRRRSRHSRAGGDNRRPDVGQGTEGQPDACAQGTGYTGPPEYIVIEPLEPDYVYVPVYDPVLIYGPSSGAGLYPFFWRRLMGGWSRDCVAQPLRRARAMVPLQWGHAGLAAIQTNTVLYGSFDRSPSRPGAGAAWKSMRRIATLGSEHRPPAPGRQCRRAKCRRPGGNRHAAGQGAQALRACGGAESGKNVQGLGRATPPISRTTRRFKATNHPEQQDRPDQQNVGQPRPGVTAACSRRRGQQGW